MLKWGKHLSVGNAIIDSEHKNLLIMVNDLSAIIKTKDSAALLLALEQFEHWLCAHFENEETIARAVNYDFARNKLEHEKLLKEFQRMKKEAAAKNRSWSGSTAKQYSRFLGDWIVGHIMEEDMLMKTVLQTHDYSFTPTGLAQ